MEFLISNQFYYVELIITKTTYDFIILNVMIKCETLLKNNLQGRNRKLKLN